ncbi:MAG TPA: glycosyltransferase family 4 protein [Pyrinomonadaceae bacterium]|nr:glycosyltransferase family 4 protein [Pyrinomonadaceae bacterium]
MRILQISSAQSLGGGERHLADLANGLADRGHEVHVALRAKSPLIRELQSVPGQNIHTLPLRNALDAKSARDLARLVKQHEIQIVHAHMARDYPPAAYAARRNATARLIITRHVLFAMNRLHRITLSGAARVIAVSQAVSTQLKADAICDAGKISVVLNGIDVARFQKARAKFDRKKFLDEWELNEENQLVGIIGELTPLKGQEEFLRAAALVAQQLPNARFIVAGIDHSSGKKYQGQLRRLLAELNLGERVKFGGWVDDLARLYCGLDVLVSASHTESFGLVLAEAMASGTAVVATSTAGASELVTMNQTGLIVPVGEVEQLAAGVLRLLVDKKLTAKLAANAQNVAAEKFTVARMISETENIYAGVL